MNRNVVQLRLSLVKSVALFLPFTIASVWLLMYFLGIVDLLPTGGFLAMILGEGILLCVLLVTVWSVLTRVDVVCEGLEVKWLGISVKWQQVMGAQKGLWSPFCVFLCRGPLVPVFPLLTPSTYLLKAKCETLARLERLRASVEDSQSIGVNAFFGTYCRG